MAHSGIRKRPGKNGTRWNVRYEVRDPATGKVHESSKTFDTLREAKAFQADRANDVRAGRGGLYAPQSRTTTVGAVWKEFAVLREASVSPKTWSQSREHWELRIEGRWAAVPVRDVTASDVIEWSGTLTCGAWSRQKSVQLLQMVLDHAVRRSVVATNVAREVSVKVPPRTSHRYLSSAEVDRLAKSLGEPGSLGSDVVLTLGYTGIRWGECAGLRVSSLSVERARLHIVRSAVDVRGKLIEGPPKTAAGRRVIPVPAFLNELLKARTVGRDPEEPLFTAPRGGMLRAGAFRRHVGWTENVRRAGLEPLTLHTLRHSYASIARAAGADLKMIQATMGHSSVVVTASVYADLFDDELDSLSCTLDALHRAHPDNCRTNPVQSESEDD